MTNEALGTSWLYNVEAGRRAQASLSAAEVQEHMEAVRASLTALQREHGADVAVALEGLRLAADTFLAGLPGVATLYRVTAKLADGGNGWNLTVTAVATGGVVWSGRIPGGQHFGTVAASKALATAGWTVHGTWQRPTTGQAWTAAVRVRQEGDRYARNAYATSASGLWSVQS